MSQQREEAQDEACNKEIYKVCCHQLQKLTFWEKLMDCLSRPKHANPQVGLCTLKKSGPRIDKKK